MPPVGKQNAAAQLCKDKETISADKAGQGNVPNVKGNVPNVEGNEISENQS